MKEKHIAYKRAVNYYETDRMRIVHHSNYIRYFEEARLLMLQELVMDYAQMEKMGIIIPVTFAECQYLLPLRFGDEIIIDTYMTKYDGIKMEVDYRIYRKDSDVLCTTGRTGHCFLDEDLKPIRMKRKFPELYGKLKNLIGHVEKETK